jgi:FimV-like protein
METKLELVKAYIDMNDSDGAKATANEVLENGTAEQKKIAIALMKGLK